MMGGGQVSSAVRACVCACVRVCVRACDAVQLCVLPVASSHLYHGSLQQVRVWHFMV
jgi:hypothetical protein